MLGALELFARLLHRVQFGTGYDRLAVLASEDHQITPQTQQRFVEGEVEYGIHPYFGYVLIPKQAGIPDNAWALQHHFAGPALRPVVASVYGGTLAANELPTLDANGSDPQFLLALPPLPENKHWRVRVRLETEHGDTAQLFFAALGQEFAEERSVSRAVVPGTNDIAFQLEPESAAIALRLDPGTNPGRYRIHSIALDSVDKFWDNMSSQTWRDRSHFEATQGFPFNSAQLGPPDGNASRLRVLLLGGSVAVQLGGSRGAIEQALQRQLNARGLPVQAEVFTAALGGFKEPQQLFAAQYFLLQGFHFDMIITVDGFNEITLPLCDNQSTRVNPFFPRKWDLRFFNKNIAREVAQLDELNEARDAIQAEIRDNPLLYSAAAGALYRFRLNRNRDTFAAIMARLAGIEKSFDQTGPGYAGDGEALLVDSAALWARATQQLQTICAARGIECYFFLQPNQYVVGSKPFSEQELREFILPAGYGPVAAKGYPLLQKEGQRLQAEGLPFKDLTGVFAGEQRTVYIDSCCHFNTLGLDTIAEAVAGFMAQRSALMGSTAAIAKEKQ